MSGTLLHFWIVAKYIERNPIKANMVESVDIYKHQSFFQWNNKSKYYEVIKDSKIFDMTIVEYTDYISSDLEIDAIEIVYKSPKLVKIDGKFKLLSKRLETFFELDQDINRDENIKKAYNYGYKKSDIAKLLNLNHSTISRII